ncbi:MAG: tetratricopeptide repeat protein [Bacteroidia bacterium]
MQSSPDDKNIFAPTACIPPLDMLAYSKQKLSGKEQRIVEEHLADCELCSAALEGFLAVPVSIPELNELRNRVNKAAGHGYLFSLGAKIIGGVFVIAISASVIWLLNRPSSQEKEGMKFVTSVSLDSLKQKHSSPSAMVLENKEPLPEEKNEVRNFSPQEKFIKAPVVQSPVSVLNSNSASTADNNSARMNSASNVQVYSNSNTTGQQNSVPVDNNSTLRNSASSVKDNSVAANLPAEVVVPAYNRPMRFIYNLKVSDYDQFYRVTNANPNYLNRGTPSPMEEHRMTESNEILREPVQVQSADLILRDGLLYFSRGNYSKALSKFNTLLEVNTEDVNALFYTALCYYNMKLPERSMKCLDKVIRSDNNAFREEALWFKAQSLLMNNDKTTAREILKKITDDKGFYAQQAKEKLKELK